jgi:hypothetical protein
MTSIIWNHKFYHKYKAFPDFFNFVAWLVDNEEFVMLIDGRGFKVTTSSNGHEWNARTEDHGGDNLQSVHAKTKAEAIEALHNNLKEAIYEDKI